MKPALSSPPPGAAPIRRMRAENRRVQIIQAAIEVFAKRGFQGATTKQLAEAAGVSEAIIFRHFATKRDLYAAILDWKAQESGREQWLEEVSALAARGEDEKLFYAVALRLLEIQRRDPTFHRLMIYAALEGHEFSAMMHSRRWPVHSFLKDYIVKRQKAGALRKLDPELLVFAVMGMPCFAGLVTQVFGFNRMPVPDQEAARVFSQILTEGIKRERSANGPAAFVPTRSSKSDVHVTNR